MAVWNSRQATVIALGLPLTIVALFLWWHYAVQTPSGLHKLTVAGNTIYVSIAQTETEREQGLSGRAGLGNDEGMLFIFPAEGAYAFWMKDMNFSIDMLWIANDGTIVYIKPDAAPESYPESFVSNKPARYVLELPAGYSSSHNIKLGDKIDI